MNKRCVGWRLGAAVIAVLCLARFAGPAAAQDSAEEYRTWAAKFFSAHAGHEYCPPPGSTIGSVTAASEQYAASHFGVHTQFTDAQWLQMLGEIYPCRKPKILSPQEARAMASKPVGSVSGNYTVQATGVYTTIDAARTNAPLDQLHGPPSDDLRRTVERIKQNSGDYAPVVLMQVAMFEYDAGEINDAIFWRHAGIVRLLLDSKLSTDPSVATVPNVAIGRSPPGLLKLAFSDDPRVAAAVAKVVVWDRETPYHYDHRWIALSGAGATQSALDPDHVPKVLTIPEAQWPKVMQDNREAYPGVVEANVAHLKAVLAAQQPAPTSPSGCGLTAAVDYHGWTGLDGWTDALKPKLAGWWREINRALGGPPCTEIRAIRLEFFAIKPDGVGASAQGDGLIINAPYVKANLGNPDMARMIAHELVHLAQAYPKGAGPDWLKEGIADYIRYYVLFPDDPGRTFDPGREDWREGYSPTAGMLAWAEAKWPGTVAKVNAAMRRGEPGDAALTAATGAKPEALWSAYMAGHPDAASAARRRAYWESLQPPKP